MTEGYTHHGLSFTPYSLTLLEKLRTNLSLSSQYNIAIDTDGMSGDQVTGSFLGRMEDRYDHPLTKHLPYDWVVFLGGTNDLGWGKSTEEIHSAIKAVTDIPLSYSARVLIMTVPECSAKIASLDARRDELNQAIWDDSRDDVFTLDLYAKMPYHSMSKDERKEIWDDGLHFTAAGYARIGTLVAERLVEILQREAELRDGEDQDQD